MKPLRPHFSGYIAYIYPQGHEPKIGRNHGTPLNYVQDKLSGRNGSVDIFEAAVIPQSLHGKLHQQLEADPRVTLVANQPGDFPRDEAQLKAWAGQFYYDILSKRSL
jgi:hypothetical protein